MSFSTRIANYTNSVTGLNVTDALLKGIDFCLGVVHAKNPEMLRMFAYEVDQGNDFANGYEWEKKFSGAYLLGAKRGIYHCRPVSDRQANDLADSTSIYYAMAKDPAYYLDESAHVSIKPTPAAGSTAKLHIVPSSGGRTVDDINERITIQGWSNGGISYVGVADKHFPDAFKELVVLHASELLLIERLVDFTTKLPTDLDADTTLFDQIADLDISITYTFPTTDFNAAVKKAKDIISDKSEIGGDGAPLTVQEWLEDEDEDMVASTLQVAATELSRANAYLSKFQSELNAQVTSKGQELKEFQTNLAKKIQLYNEIIKKISVDYQWMQGALQMVAGKKQEFIGTQLMQGPQSGAGKEVKI